jgi:hypothetical protein
MGGLLSSPRSDALHAESGWQIIRQAIRMIGSANNVSGDLVTVQTGVPVAYCGRSERMF